MANQEVYIGPATVYVAPLSTAFPSVDAAPAVDWVQLGTNGASSITEDGITFNSATTKTDIFSLGSIYAIKSANTSSDTNVAFSIMDMTAEQMAYALGLDPDTAVVDTAAASGVAGVRTLTINTPSSPTEMALLIRCEEASPYGQDFVHQWQFPRAAVTSNITGTYSKTTPFTVAMTWTCYFDSTLGGVGAYVAQDAIALA